MSEPQILFAEWRDSGQVDPQDWEPMQSMPWRPLQETLPIYDTQGRIVPPEDDANDKTSIDLDAQAYQDAYAQAQHDIEAWSKRLEASVEQLSQIWGEHLQSCEAQLTQLALTIAEELVLQDMPAQRGFTEKMVQHALKMLADAESLTLRMHPRDLEYIKKSLPQIASRPGLRFVEDAGIEYGGVIAESSKGRIDASMQERLRAMRRNLQVDNEQGT